MITFTNGGVLIEEPSQLPNLAGSKEVFIDFETSSGNPKLTSTNPWHTCMPIGTCITVDDCETAWYIPWEVEHKAWLQEVFDKCDAWVNHGIKYDAHVITLAGLRIPDVLVDTLTLAKLIESDRFTYGLKVLNKDWLKGEDYEDEIKIFLKNSKSKDFGILPHDMIGRYGCGDVLVNRKLWHFIQEKMPEQCQGVMATEIKLTSVLFDVEQEGLRVDPTDLAIKELQTLSKLCKLDEEIDEICGFAMRANTNADCFEFLCTANGLPVLGMTDKGEPSFDKFALKEYLLHPTVTANVKLTKAVKMILAYRKLYTLLTLFIIPFKELSVDDILHASYNQSVRTGRMSCSKPNMQQNNSSSKALLRPRKIGESFLSVDYSQVEFRLIVHYIRNIKAIQAYADNPNTDFHQWVADMSGTNRDAGKTLNFAIAFGGGKDKVVELLANNMTFMQTVMTKAGGNRKVFESLCRKRAEQVFNKYHKELPELKLTTRQAAMALKNKGFVFNSYGRHRHLPEAASYRAFNTIIQSTAADLLKERMVATSPRFNSRIRELEIKQVAAVHDEILFTGNEFTLMHHANEIRATMESVPIRLTVPIRADVRLSTSTWAACADADATIGREVV